MNQTTKTLGEVVAGALAGAGISERDAAERTNIPRSTLKRHLTSGNFTVDELASLAHLLGVRVSDLTTAAEVAA